MRLSLGRDACRMFGAVPGVPQTVPRVGCQGCHVICTGQSLCTCRGRQTDVQDRERFLAGGLAAS